MRLCGQPGSSRVDNLVCGGAEASLTISDPLRLALGETLNKALLARVLESWHSALS